MSVHGLRTSFHATLLLLALPALTALFAGLEPDNGCACPPAPELEERIASGAIAEPYFLTNRKAILAKGICAESENSSLGSYLKAIPSVTAGPQNSGQAASFRALAVLVKFSDKGNITGASFFDTLLFVDQAGTVRNYYKEVSYSALDMISLNNPSALGWQTAPQTYAYYCNNANGTGSYPQNSQKLCEDLVDLIDAQVNFANYDNDGDGFVDAFVIIHSGRGAELTGAATDIWSHKWGISPRLRDGVRIRDYTIQPEYWYGAGDMTCGVYAHELGHAFGLPDLYDTDYTSWGVGRWCLMASGAWNGSLGNSPSHPCAWSRIQMGFATPSVVLANTNTAQIASVNSGGAIYKLWTGGVPLNEYFLVENRQKTGYDAALPGSGLLIWHIDDNKNNNDVEWYPSQPNNSHLLVALEQADGLWQLEHKTNTGDAADPWPGTGSKIAFSPSTTPSSNSYSAQNTFVAVSAISPSAATMTANFTVSLLAGGEEDESSLPNGFVVRQNYPNPFNPKTTISFDVPTVSNVTVTVYNVVGQIITRLLDAPLGPGAITVDWDGLTSVGGHVASGVYFYEVVVGAERATRAMTLLK